MAEIIETRPRVQTEDADQDGDKKKKQSKTKQGKDSKKESKSDTKSKTDEADVKAEDLDYYVHYSECEFSTYRREHMVLGLSFFENLYSALSCVFSRTYQLKVNRRLDEWVEFERFDKSSIEELESTTDSSAEVIPRCLSSVRHLSSAENTMGLLERAPFDTPRQEKIQ
jgi:hypothetical protein